MNVNSITVASQDINTGSLERGLGKDDFLKLLVAQLRYQDPMNPMSNTEFIAQMAQFSALEQMYNLNNSFYVLQQQIQETFMLQAVSLIGKEVTAEVEEQTITGTVEKVNWTVAGAILTVDGQQLPLSSVIAVALPEPPPPVEPAVAELLPVPPAEEAGVDEPLLDTEEEPGTDTDTTAREQEAGDSPDTD